MTETSPTSPTAGVQFEIDDHRVGWLTIDRPEEGNSLTAACRSKMVDVFRTAGARLEVRCIVLTATGDRHFCTGGDLRSMQPVDFGPGAPEHPVGEMRRRLASSAQVLIGAILDCDVPVVAAVNGTAAGMGAQLAFACDLVVAADHARFVQAFQRRGLVPDAGAAYLLPRLVGLQRAKRMLLLDEDLTPRDAEALGLVSEVVPRDQLVGQVTAWAYQIAAGPTTAMGLTRRMLNRSLDDTRDVAFDREAAAVEMNSRTEDVAEGIAAFLERREARFQGW